ncbi:MAG: hypothetical protein RIS34_2350 [Pseudomonadota bacterium]|jgi:3-phenylpropionate/trans-cinnamate dioxygenase ferredoxin reductase subunit
MQKTTLSPPPADPAAMVIVGAGHCGGRAAQALRESGWSGAIHLVGDEVAPPYERPPLSKDLLTGDKSAGDCTLLPVQTMVDLGITRHIARVMSIDTKARCVVLSDGVVLTYAALLLTTGGRVRTLNIPGSDLPEVMTLRGLDDAAALATRLTPGHRLVVIGGGFIGLEVAASARKLGCDVVLIEGAPRLMGRAVPEPLAERALALHRARGVQVILDARLQSIKPLARGVAVALADGTSVEADTVLVGVGIEPATELAQAAGLTVQRGVVVNAHLQTSAPGVYAAGDVVEFPSALSGQLIRQETWHNAETQARIAAVNMQGGEQAYLALPWFWSDQYDYQLQVAGEPALAVTSVMRVLQEDDLIVFYLDDAGRLVGACGWGLSSRMARELKIARTLVERAVPVAADVLADPASKLKALLSQHQAPIAS